MGINFFCFYIIVFLLTFLYNKNLYEGIKLTISKPQFTLKIINEEKDSY